MKFDTTAKLATINFLTSLFFLSPIATFFYMQRGLNLFEIVSLEAVLVVFITLFNVPTGIFADKYGRKASIIAFCMLLITSEIILLFSSGFWMFAIAFAMSGIAIAFSSGAWEALLYDSLKEQKKERLMRKAMGTVTSSALAASVIANVIGSIIAADLSMQTFVLLIEMTIIVMAIGILFSFTLKEPEYKQQNKEQNPFKLFAEGIKQIKSNPSLLRIILLYVFSSPFFIVLTLLYQPYFKFVGVNVAWFGTIIAIALILSALAGKYAYKVEEKLGVKLGMLLVTLTPGIFYILIAIAKNLFIAIASVMVIMAFNGFREPLFSHYRNVHLSSFNRATTLSIISLLASAYEAVARPAIGWVANININWAFLAIGVIVIVTSLTIRLNPEHVKHVVKSEF
jgi:MFS family permease